MIEAGQEQTLTWRHSEDLPVDSRFADIDLDLCGGLTLRV